mmetsp:Transcript_14290/g.29809  ORF Transcript_14290/g.29809 Transcript_14290/m.29809 type:complete len:121 (+) Transcript_14290:247-609(+)
MEWCLGSITLYFFTNDCMFITLLCTQAMHINSCFYNIIDGVAINHQSKLFEYQVTMIWWIWAFWSVVSKFSERKSSLFLRWSPQEATVTSFNSVCTFLHCTKKRRWVQKENDGCDPTRKF